MRTAVQFLTALAISLWGASLALIGLTRGVPLWSAIGVVIAGAGVPLLGSHPWARALLYRDRGPIEGPGAAADITGGAGAAAGPEAGEAA